MQVHKLNIINALYIWPVSIVLYTYIWKGWRGVETKQES